MVDQISHDPAIIRQWVRQRLESLCRFGVSALDRPTGNLEFHFADPEPVSEFVSEFAPRQSAGGRPTVASGLSTSEVGAGAGESRSDIAAMATTEKVISPSGGNPTPSSKPVLAERVITGEYSRRPDDATLTAELQILQDSVAACAQCPELAVKRSQTVFGVGNVRPRLVFLGEAPGEDEDRAGEPFVGRAGELLTKIIGAMKLTRDEVYILNTVKCRPPMNRNPNDTELANCWGFLTGQLDLLQPEIICCLGSVASRTLLNTTDSIGRLRGSFHRYKSSRVIVTYHPSYLLRVEKQDFRGKSPKKMVWDDMKLIMAELERGSA